MSQPPQQFHLTILKQFSKYEGPVLSRPHHSLQVKIASYEQFQLTNIQFNFVHFFLPTNFGEMFQEKMLYQILLLYFARKY